MDDQRVRIQEDLRGVLRGEVRCDDIFLQLYASDASIYQIRPLAVAMPRNTADVIACVQYANEHNLPIHARGAGTSLIGQSLGGGIVLDFSKHMRRVLDISGKTVRVQPGLVLDRLNLHLRASNRVFGPDPATRRVTTMGSVIAVNGGGARWPRYGSTREHLLSLQVVLADGTLCELGREARPGPHPETNDSKTALLASLDQVLTDSAGLIRRHQPRSLVNTCGYLLRDVLTDESIDVARLLCGSEGTLAIVTEATLRTDRLPKHRAVVLLLFEQLEAAALASLELAQLHPTACELMDRRCLSLACDTDVRYDLLISPQAEAALMVEIEGENMPELRHRVQQVIDQVTTVRSLAFDAKVGYDEEEMNLFWELSRKIVPTLYRLKGSTRPLPFIEDMAVAPHVMPRFLIEIQNILKRHHVTASLFAHALQGQIHLRPFLDLSEQRDVTTLRRLTDDVYAAVLDARGTVSGEHGDGLARTPFVERQYRQLYSVFRDVKRIFDPHNVFNPGKIVTDDPLPMGTSLRPVDLPAVAARGSTSEQVEPELPPMVVPLQLHWTPNEMAHMAQACNGCGACRSQDSEVRMCPIFRFAPREEASPRAKANLVRAVLTGQLPPETVSQEAFKAVADLCVNCQMCRLECPAGVDIPRLVMEAKGEYVAVNGLPLRERLLARLDLISAISASMWRFSNWVIQNHQMRWLLARMLGLAQERKLARYAPRSFLRTAARHRLTRPTSDDGPKVLYFVDTFANYHDPQLAESLVSVLKHNGVSVYVPPAQLPSGMSLISAGMIEKARRMAAHNVGLLVEAVRQGYHIVATEPAAALCLTYEYPILLEDSDARLVAENSSEACHYLWTMHQQGNLRLDMKSIRASLGYHQPCHVKALQVGEPAYHLLGLIPGLNVKRTESGCSGMAGSFGLKQENFRDSLRAGWGLITSLRNPSLQAGTTECSACKIQMEQGADKPTIHPLKLMALAYGLMPEVESLLTTPCEELVVT